MKKLISTGAALMLTTSIAAAGGIDRSGNSYGILFEPGNAVELSFSSVSPDVSGDYPAALGGGSTGNMSPDFRNIGAAIKYAINDQFDVALMFNRPYGANAAYEAGVYQGLTADWESNQVSLVLKYKLNDNVSVYGGVRSIESKADIVVPLSVDLVYLASTAADRQTGYILGGAYERPDIALRVALTYESGVTHAFDTVETVTGRPATSSVTEIEMPQAVTLDFQTGVAADTLLFGSVRWSEWSKWEVRPAVFQLVTGDRVTGIDNDVTTYRVGLGRRLNDNLSIFGRVTYEDSTGDTLSRLSPTDGMTSVGLGGTYSVDDAKITAGVEYSMLGDGVDASGTAFEDNTALAFGVTLGFSF